MFRYEIFRQSVIGWFLIASFIWLSFPYLNLAAWNDRQWAVSIVVTLLSSSVFGYLISQLNRAYYLLSGTRPNDRKIAIKYLHKEFARITANLSPSNNTLIAFRLLRPKDLHRFVWVAFANQKIRNRSESYWERYYTNICISIAVSVGSTLALSSLIVRLPLCFAGTWIRLGISIVLIVALWIINREYVRISANIENTWIHAFLAELEKRPHFFSEEIFKR